MCDECWAGHGKPAVWSERVAAAVSLVDTLYGTGDGAGPWHSVMENWALTDGAIAYCGASVAGWGWDDYWGDCADAPLPAARQAAADLWPALTAMTVDERASVLAFAHGHVARPA